MHTTKNRIVLLVICAENNPAHIQRWGGKQKVKLKIIEIVLTGFLIKEVHLLNP
jgi:hypothetical protein